MRLSLEERQANARRVAYQTPDAEAMAIYRERLETKFTPGQHFTNADLHRVVWPKAPLAWMGVHREHLARIADAMEDADLIMPSFGPRGGEGWALTPDKGNE